MYMSVLFACMFMPGTCIGQKTVFLGSLGPELQTVMSCHVGAWNCTQILWEAVSVLHC